MASSPIKNVRVKKTGIGNWSKIREFSFPKIDLLLFDNGNAGLNRSILRDTRGQNIFPVITAIKRGSTFNQHIHENICTITNIKHRT